ncbi:MAG: hypothetical protein ACKVS8_04885 [Phycisphaerales bacterium]
MLLARAVTVATLVAAPLLCAPAAHAQTLLSSSASIQHASNLATSPAARSTSAYTACRVEYNDDGAINPDDIGDFITDYYTMPGAPGPGAFAVPCPTNEPPFDAGYKAAYTSDGSPQCFPPFPDNLGDYITDYFIGCAAVPVLSSLPDFTNPASAVPPLQLAPGALTDLSTGATTTASCGVGTLSAPGMFGIVFSPTSSLTQGQNPGGPTADPASASTLTVTFNASWQLNQPFGPTAFAGLGLAMSGAFPVVAPPGTCTQAARNALAELDAEFAYTIPGGPSGILRLPLGYAPMAASAGGCGPFSAEIVDRAVGLPAQLPAGTIVSISGTLTLRVRNGDAQAGITGLLAASPEQGPAGVFITFDPPGPPCTTDFNRDGRVDPVDLALFTSAHASTLPGPGGFATPCPANPAPFNAGYAADFNGDCALTTADSSAFIAAYSTPGPSPLCPVDSISAFTDIPGLIAAWDARLSAPTFDPATGEVLSLGTELSGQSSISIARGGGTVAPRWSASPEGLICLGQYDVAPEQRGMGIRFDLPPGNWANLKLMTVVCITPTNQGGDFRDDVMRLVASNGDTGMFSLSKRVSRVPALDPGRAETNGGAGVGITTTRAGCERQVLGSFTAFPSPGAATAFVNGLGRSTPGTCSNDHVSAITVGFLDGPSGSTIGPFQGIIHAVYVYALDTAEAGNFTERDCRNAGDLLALQWAVTAAPTKAVSISGDSITYASGTQFDSAPNFAAPTPRHTILTAAVSANTGGAASIPVASRNPGGVPIASNGNGGAGRYIIEPGTDRAEVVRISNGPLSGPGSLGIIGTLRYAHPAGSLLADNGYGFINPAASCWNRSALTGGDPDVRLFNFAQPGAQLSSIYAVNPSPDGSTRVFDAVSPGGRTLFVQRGGNDLNSGLPVPTLYSRLRTFILNARNAGGSPPDKIIACEVLPRATWSAGGNSAAMVFNTQTSNGLRDPALGADAICSFARHPWLSDPLEPGYIFVPETLGATSIIGCIYDASGVHPRAFGQACMALAIDSAYAQAWGTTVPYAPAAPVATGTIQPAGLRLNWSTPTSPGAPSMIGDTTSGASCLVVKIDKNGSKLVWIAPTSVNANTGAATYLTTYFDDEFTPGDTYTIRVEDAMGNTSPQQTIVVP